MRLLTETLKNLVSDDVFYISFDMKKEKNLFSFLHKLEKFNSTTLHANYYMSISFRNNKWHIFCRETLGIGFSEFNAVSFQQFLKITKEEINKVKMEMILKQQ